MDARTIRQAMVDGLEAGAVHKIAVTRTRNAFLAGELDLRFADLGMDSLARMELCIAIEIGTGVSLAPEELDRYESLVALAEDIARRCR
jgi:acyl carrier protein